MASSRAHPTLPRRPTRPSRQRRVARTPTRRLTSSSVTRLPRTSTSTAALSHLSEAGRQQARPDGRLGKVERREPRDLYLAESLDRLEVGALHGAGLTGPWGQNHELRVEADRPHGLDRQQAVVDRAEARGGGDHDRQAEVAGEVAHQVAEGERHEEATDALADQHVGA